MTGDGTLEPAARERPRRGWANLPTLLALWAIVIGASLIASAASESLQQSAVTALINLIIVVSLYIFTGNSGVFSFGQPAFAVVGAFTAAILVLPQSTKAVLIPSMFHFLQAAQVSPTVATLIGGAVAGAVALVVSAPLMRLSGLNAAIGTLALLVIVNVVGDNWQAVTNGTEGIPGVPTIGLAPVLIAAVLTVAVAWLFQQTSVAVRLRATREDDVAAASIGISVAVVRTVAFCISGFVAGIAGGLFAQVQGAAVADSFYLDMAFITIAMLVVGGIGSLSGAVVGTLGVSVLVEFLTRLQDGLAFGSVKITAPIGVEQIVLALALLGVLVRRPGGIMGGRELLSAGPWRKRRGTLSPSGDEAGVENHDADPELDSIVSETPR